MPKIVEQESHYGMEEVCITHLWRERERESLDGIRQQGVYLITLKKNLIWVVYVNFTLKLLLILGIL